MGGGGLKKTKYVHQEKKTVLEKVFSTIILRAAGMFSSWKIKGYVEIYSCWIPENSPGQWKRVVHGLLPFLAIRRDRPGIQRKVNENAGAKGPVRLIDTVLCLDFFRCSRESGTGNFRCLVNSPHLPQWKYFQCVINNIDWVLSLQNI